jgi:mannose-6-phosphate isomerase-like protein (cupin superfamily)
MKIIAKNQAAKIQNSDQCKVTEYPFDIKDINGSVISVKGRYPENGYAMNEVRKEIVYIINGSGKITMSDGSITKFDTGDSLFIDTNEKYFWQGQFESYMACSPAFYPEQHKEIEN